MESLETEYNDILFRSRLEARWAILFDSLNLEWVYEPECYILSNQKKYTPDFYIPKYDLNVEIKPNFEWLNNKYHIERYKLFNKPILILSGSFPNFNINALFNEYIIGEYQNVVFCPNIKYEPFFYSGENLGSNEDFAQDYKKEIKFLKQYRFY